MMDLNGDLFLGFNALDVIVVLLLLVFLLHGAARGIGRTIGGAVGLVLGATLALLLLPHIEISEVGRWARLAILGVVLVICMVVGQALGEALLGRIAGGPPRSSRILTFVDRAGGGAIGAAIGVIVVLALGGFLGQVPAPWLNAQLESSRSLQAIERWTPPAVIRALGTAQEELAGAPAIRELDALLYPAVEPPQTEIDDPEVTAASASTVRILGAAAECGYNQSGSGFVTAAGQVVTNAHVVQGTDGVSVYTSQGQRHAADVVSFVPEHDLAVLSVPGLELGPLSIAQGAESGTEAAFIGYPLSGPLAIGAATVQGSAYTSMGSMDGSMPVQVTQFAGNVQQGNSGGPLVDMDGQVIGVVFGKAVDDPAGYAVDTGTLTDVLAGAAGADQPVGTGQCQAA
ncbi:MarP family serine protease [Kocuria coralli]|uniref:MarP family serine protease n=1 Tax=Kocuria coralli TaxID=1461025 RepID=A0A5J5L2J1_9MICC|nr:MarP family serine protease [Kocuria coralli]KAA9395316.1 MarP family serine protease [Kocuria coralli]